MVMESFSYSVFLRSQRKQVHTAYIPKIVKLDRAARHRTRLKYHCRDNSWNQAVCAWNQLRWR